MSEEGAGIVSRTAHRRGLTRRQFFLTSGLAAGAASITPKARAAAIGPNETVRLGVIGTGGMGRAHLYALAQEQGCEIAAMCDVWRRRYEEPVGKVEQLAGYRPDVYQDFFHVLDRGDIDAVFVVTPDHWHPLLTILACQAGKDVYVEKPACTAIEEGRAMVEAARRYGRVVQLGTQQRSMPVFQEAMELIHSGTLGAISTASAWVGVNAIPEEFQRTEPPPDLDWDRWLGPAPAVPYSPQRHLGWMAWHDYARGGELTNWGVHLLDIVQWGIGEQWPLTVQAAGANGADGAWGDNYLAVDALFEYPNCTVAWEQRPHPEHEKQGYGIQFHGEKGRLIVDRGSFKVYPESLGIPEFVGAPEKSWASEAHHQNFFDCIRTRQRPVADIEQGVRSTAVPLLAGIALKTGRKLHWDGKAERFLNDEAANQWLTRPYRAPWRLV